MERDFLGLGSKTSPITVKEETSDSSKDSGPSRGLGLQWSVQAKVSATPQFLSFKQSQEDRPRRSNNDHSASSGFLPTSSPDQFDSLQRSHYNSLQPFETYTISRPMPPVSMNLPSHVSGGKNFVGHSLNRPSLGGAPIMAPPVSVLPAPSPFVGTTDVRYAAKPAGSPAQLTIFYAGSVCVYDDISPEKAQAIMLLAGNGSALPQNKPVPAVQVHSSIPRSPAAFVGMNNSRPTVPQIAPQFGSCSNELPTAVKTVGGFSSSCTQTERTNVGCSIGPAVALPQARKASLVRFLEKRKERVTSVEPYSVAGKFNCRTPSEALSSSVTSGSSSNPTVASLR